MSKNKHYQPTPAVTHLAAKLSKAMADCLREEDRPASDNLEAALLCCVAMSTSRSPKGADTLGDMARAVSQARESMKPKPAIIGTDGAPL